MLEDNVANDPNDNAEIVIQGFYFYIFYEYEGVIERDKMTFLIC